MDKEAAENRYLGMKRSEGFDFDRRDSRFDNDYMGPLRIPWTAELVSSEGAHFHCWIKKDIPVGDKATMLENFKRLTRNRRDAVSFSYDYIPADFEGYDA